MALNTELLEREIERELENVEKLNPGSKEHSEAVVSICKLHDAFLDQKKAELERDKFEEDVKLSDRREANAEVYHEEELEQKNAERKERRRERLIKVLSILAPVIGTGIGCYLYDKWSGIFLTFEKDDSFSTNVGKTAANRLDRLLPKN